MSIILVLSALAALLGVAVVVYARRLWAAQQTDVPALNTDPNSLHLALRKQFEPDDFEGLALFMLSLVRVARYDTAWIDKMFGKINKRLTGRDALCYHLQSLIDTDSGRFYRNHADRSMDAAVRWLSTHPLFVPLCIEYAALLRRAHRLYPHFEAHAARAGLCPSLNLIVQLEAAHDSVAQGDVDMQYYAAGISDKQMQRLALLVYDFAFGEYPSDQFDFDTFSGLSDLRGDLREFATHELKLAADWQPTMVDPFADLKLVAGVDAFYSLCQRNIEALEGAIAATETGFDPYDLSNIRHIIRLIMNSERSVTS